MDFTKYADASIVAEAKARFLAATAARDAGRADNAAKHAAAEAAEKAVEIAADGRANGGEHDLSAAVDAAQAAKKAADVSDIALAALERAHAAAWADHHSAASRSMEPAVHRMAEEAVQIAREHHAARAALSAALEWRMQFNSAVAASCRAGAKLPFNGAMLEPLVNHPMNTQPEEFQRLLRTPQDEAALWAGADV